MVGWGAPARGVRSGARLAERQARALAAPASLKGVLDGPEAAAALAEGLRVGGADADELPVADGGDGSLSALAVARGGTWHAAPVHDAFGRPHVARWLALPDGTAAVEAARAIPLDPSRLDPLAASSRGLGELVAAALATAPRALLVCLGGTATVDGGAGLREVVGQLAASTIVACDVDVPLVDAVRVFAAQKGAGPEEAAELERRLLGMTELAPHAKRPGAGAAGGLGAAFAALGAALVPGAPYLLDAAGFDARPYGLVVTGEGTVDRTTPRGKAPAEVARRAARAGVPCVVFGGRVVEGLPDVETVPLSGHPGRARADLVALGRRLAGRLAAELLGE